MCVWSYLMYHIIVIEETCWYGAVALCSEAGTHDGCSTPYVVLLLHDWLDAGVEASVYGSCGALATCHMGSWVAMPCKCTAGSCSGHLPGAFGYNVTIGWSSSIRALQCDWFLAYKRRARVIWSLPPNTVKSYQVGYNTWWRGWEYREFSCLLCIILCINWLCNTRNKIFYAWKKLSL